MLSAWRLAWLQARWAPRQLVLAGAVLVLASATLALLAALGCGVQRAGDAYLGERLPTATFDVVPPQAKLAAALWGGDGGPAETALDGAARQALAELAGVRTAVAVVDLRLPLMAEGGEALLGRALRADLLVTGVDPAAARPAHDAPPFLLPFVDPGEDRGDGAVVPVLVHPALLLSYNAAVAPSLGTPQLSPEALMGLPFTVRVGPSHLPGRAPVRAQGSFSAAVVGLSEVAQPLGLSVPAATAQRLWARYSAAGGTAPLARVRVTACTDDDVPRLQARVRKLGLDIDDAAAQARAVLALVRRLGWGVALALGALLAGAGAWALGAHVADGAGPVVLFRTLGHARVACLGAVALQGLVVGALGGAGGVALARLAAAQAQAALQRLADAWALRLPELFVFFPRTAASGVATLALLAAAGSALALAGRLDKRPGPR